MTSAVVESVLTNMLNYGVSKTPTSLRLRKKGIGINTPPKTNQSTTRNGIRKMVGSEIVYSKLHTP